MTNQLLQGEWNSEAEIPDTVKDAFDMPISKDNLRIKAIQKETLKKNAELFKRLAK